MKKPTMGIQLYTLRDHIQNAEDFDNTLSRLSALGVDTVQISGIGDISAPVQKNILHKYSMTVCVTHKPFDRMCNDLDNLIAEHKIIGCDDIGLGWAGEEYRSSVDDVNRFISLCARIGEEMSRKGITFNYHNHDFEFKSLNDSGITMMDMLIEETNSDIFNFIPDVAWIDYAGADPVDYLHKLKGRVKVVHFKDYIIDENGERKFVSLGKGAVDLKACYDACCELEIPYIMYEQDCDWTDDDPFKATEESWMYMQKLLK